MNLIKSLCLLAAIALLPSFVFGADSDRPDQIVFLRLELDSAGVSLIRADVVEGRLKQPRVADTAREVRYRVYLDDGSEWLAGSCWNPRVRRIDYEDPARPGQLTGKVVIREKAPLLVRIPYHPELSHIDFSRLPITVEEAAKGRSRIDLGRVELGSVVGGDHD